jgi:hypothetical protein
MPRRDKRKKQRSPRKKRRGRIFIAFERAVLGFGMSVVAFFIERRLIKAIKKGGVTAAPRIAAEPGEELGAAPPEQRQGEVTTSPSSG